MNALAGILKPSINTPSGAAARGQYIASICDEVTREAVQAVAAQLGWRNLKLRKGGAPDALAFVKANGPPSFLLVDIDDGPDPVAAAKALVDLCAGQTQVVAIGRVNDVGLYRRLMDIGVSDYLVKPVSAPMLADAIQSAAVPEVEPPSGPTKARRMIAMIGARGGVGTTTLAVSSAWTLAQERRLPVVLLDLDLHFGSLALSLDIEPSRGLREILASPERTDSLLVAAAMSSVGERLSLLAAEEPLEDPVDFGHEGFDVLAANVAASADCLIIDLPRSLNGLARHVLSVADGVAIVTEQSLPAMRDTQRLLSLIKGMRSDAKTMIVSNRVGGVCGEVGRAEFERGCGAPIDLCIPFDAKAAIAAAEHAKPLADVARAPKTVAGLRDLAFALAGGAAPAKPTLIARMLGK
jgi:pilus assembly protein CpaE